MNQARKWWPGLVLVAVLWAIAGWHSLAGVERDMARRARQALEDTLLDDVRLSAAGRDVTLKAAAFSPDGQKSAVQFVEAAPGIRLVRDQTRLVPQASPFVWSARRDVTGITLSGDVPLPATRNKLMDLARLAAGGNQANDRMRYARGNAPRFDAAALLVLDQLGRLKTGEVRLVGSEVEVRGTARELGGREAVNAALKTLPQGFKVKSVAVEAPPFVFQANKDPVAGTVTLKGSLPDEAARAALVADAGRRVYGERIVDDLKISAGAPAGFQQAARTAIGELARLSTGMLTLSDRKVTLSGDALYEAAAAQIRERLPARVPKGYDVKTEISVRPPAAQVDITICQQIFNDTLSRNQIRFESGSAAINSESTALLDRLVEIALRCPAARIEIEGHTDSDGDAAANLALSQSRAEAVAAFLVKAGIPQARIHASGYGQTRPIAPNDTAQGKASNRRIEFHLT